MCRRGPWDEARRAEDGQEVGSSGGHPPASPTTESSSFLDNLVINAGQRELDPACPMDPPGTPIREGRALVCAGMHTKGMPGYL